jgi:hypothetical protein
LHADRLLHVPNVQPPLPSDWQIHPTHRVLPPVPYQLAQYWDNKGFRERADHRNSKKKSKTSTTATTGTTTSGGAASSSSVGRVPRDLRATAKRTPAVKSWLRVLEEPVRQFVVERGLAVVAPTPAAAAAAKHQREREEERRDGNGSDDSDATTDPDDEEIVFVGRKGLSMRDGKPSWKTARRQVVVAAGQVEEEEELGMVLDAMEDEAGGAFKCVGFSSFFFFFFPPFQFLFRFFFRYPFIVPLSLLSPTFTPFTSYARFAYESVFFTGAGSRTPSRTTMASTPSRSWWATPRGVLSTSVPSSSALVQGISRLLAGLYCRRRCGRCFEGDVC